MLHSVALIRSNAVFIWDLQCLNCLVLEVLPALIALICNLITLPDRWSIFSWRVGQQPARPCKLMLSGRCCSQHFYSCVLPSWQLISFLTQGKELTEKGTTGQEKMSFEHSERAACYCYSFKQKQKSPFIEFELVYWDVKSQCCVLQINAV